MSTRYFWNRYSAVTTVQKTGPLLQYQLYTNMAGSPVIYYAPASAITVTGTTVNMANPTMISLATIGTNYQIPAGNFFSIYVGGDIAFVRYAGDDEPTNVWVSGADEGVYPIYYDRAYAVTTGLRAGTLQGYASSNSSGAYPTD